MRRERPPTPARLANSGLLILLRGRFGLAVEERAREPTGVDGSLDRLRPGLEPNASGDSRNEGARNPELARDLRLPAVGVPERFTHGLDQFRVAAPRRGTHERNRSTVVPHNNVAADSWKVAPVRTGGTPDAIRATCRRHPRDVNPSASSSDWPTGSVEAPHAPQPWRLGQIHDAIVGAAITVVRMRRAARRLRPLLSRRLAARARAHPLPRPDACLRAKPPPADRARPRRQRHPRCSAHRHSRATTRRSPRSRRRQRDHVTYAADGRPNSGEQRRVNSRRR